MAPLTLLTINFICIVIIAINAECVGFRALSIVNFVLVLRKDIGKNFYQQEYLSDIGVRNLDNGCQRVLSLCGTSVNLNDCSTVHGNVLHAAAKYGLSESAKEALAQGYYNMLLELDDGKDNSWPLYYAVENEEWSIVKIILDTLNFR